MAIGIIVEGAREVDLRFERFPQGCHDELSAKIKARMPRLASAVRAKTPRKTGKLASEVTSSVRDTKERITGIVTVSGDFAKAGALEYGAHGTAKVGAHEARLDHVFGNQLHDPITVSVRAHTRQMNIPAHRFLRGPFEAERSEIEAELRQAVDRATNKGE